jgi:hypothetical protein
MQQTSGRENVHFPWPRFPSIWSPENVKYVQEEIEKNEKWFATEKIDAPVLCVSSNSWIGTNRFIFYQQHPFSIPSPISPKFQGVDLSQVLELHGKLDLLQRTFKRDCGIKINEITQSTFSNPLLEENDQLLLYGYFVVPGTCTSNVDVYDNLLNNYKVGKLYVFGFGFVFAKQEKNWEHVQVLRKNFDSVMINRSRNGDKTYFTCPVNEKNENYFLDCGIDLVSRLRPDTFVNHLVKTNGMCGTLKRREKAGFILHNYSSRGFAFNCETEISFYQSQMVETAVREWVQTKNQTRVAAALYELFQSRSLFVNKLELKKIDQEFERYFKRFSKALKRDLLYAEDNRESAFTVPICLQIWKTNAEMFLAFRLSQPLRQFDKRLVFKLKRLVSVRLDDFAKKALSLTQSQLDRSALRAAKKINWMTKSTFCLADLDYLSVD